MDIKDYSTKVEFWKRLEKLMTLVNIEGYYENEEKNMVLDVCAYRIAKQKRLATEPVLTYSNIPITLVSAIRSLSFIKKPLDTLSLSDLAEFTENDFRTEKGFGKRRLIMLRIALEEANLEFKY